MKKKQKPSAKAQPTARDLAPRKSPKGGSILAEFKFMPALSSPPSSLQMKYVSSTITR